MKETLETLELERAKLYQQLQALGDFRPGMISVNFRKCGKNNCACHFGRSELHRHGRIVRAVLQPVTQFHPRNAVDHGARVRQHVPYDPRRRWHLYTLAKHSSIPVEKIGLGQKKETSIPTTNLSHTHRNLDSQDDFAASLGKKIRQRLTACRPEDNFLPKNLPSLCYLLYFLLQ
jgi:hypothetical protein